MKRDMASGMIQAREPLMVGEVPRGVEAVHGQMSTNRPMDTSIYIYACQNVTLAIVLFADCYCLRISLIESIGAKALPSRL